MVRVRRGLRQRTCSQLAAAPALRQRRRRRPHAATAPTLSKSRRDPTRFVYSGLGSTCGWATGFSRSPVRRVGWWRLVVRAGVGVAGFAAKVTETAATTATEAATRASEAVLWGRPSPTFDQALPAVPPPPSAVDGRQPSAATQPPPPAGPPPPSSGAPAGSSRGRARNREADRQTVRCSAAQPENEDWPRLALRRWVCLGLRADRSPGSGGGCLSRRQGLPAVASPVAGATDEFWTGSGRSSVGINRHRRART